MAIRHENSGSRNGLAAKADLVDAFRMLTPRDIQSLEAYVGLRDQALSAGDEEALAYAEDAMDELAERVAKRRSAARKRSA